MIPLFIADLDGCGKSDSSLHHFLMKKFLSTIRLFEHSTFYYVICTDMQGNYSYVNDNYARSFNYVNESFVGKPYHITMHPNDTKVCEETSMKCLEHPDQMFPATIRKHDGKGGYIITQWEFKAGFADDGTPEGIFCIGYDITELGRSKDQLKEIAYQQSHIVRRPLANVLGIAHILSKMQMDESLKSLVDMMVQSAEELDEEVKNIVKKTNR